MTLELLIIIAIAGLYAYILVRERSSKATSKDSQQSSVVRIAFHIIPPIVGLVLILQLLGYWQFPLPLAEHTKRILYILGHGLFWMGVALVVWAREGMGIHWAHSAHMQVVEGQGLVTDGAYKYMRHPLHVALLLVFTGAQLIVGSWLVVFAVPLIITLHWQSKKEEALLLGVFGNTYRNYQNITGMYLPRLW